MRRKLLIPVVVALAMSVSACSPYAFRQVASVAIMTAAIVGTAHVLAEHDAHYHFHDCGHHRRWHHGRWVYQYDDQWEYYDPHSETWYYYDD